MTVETFLIPRSVVQSCQQTGVSLCELVVSQVSKVQRKSCFFWQKGFLCLLY